MDKLTSLYITRDTWERSCFFLAVRVASSRCCRGRCSHERARWVGRVGGLRKRKRPPLSGVFPVKHPPRPQHGDTPSSLLPSCSAGRFRRRRRRCSTVYSCRLFAGTDLRAPPSGRTVTPAGHLQQLQVLAALVSVYFIFKTKQIA